MASHARSWRHVLRAGGSVIGHAVVTAIGFAMMVVGLGLGVTMIMLPAGLVIGLLGVLIFLAGIFYRADSHD